MEPHSVLVYRPVEETTPGGDVGGLEHLPPFRTTCFIEHGNPQTIYERYGVEPKDPAEAMWFDTSDLQRFPFGSLLLMELLGTVYQVVSQPRPMVFGDPMTDHATVMLEKVDIEPAARMRGGKGAQGGGGQGADAREAVRDREGVVSPPAEATD